MIQTTNRAIIYVKELTVYHGMRPVLENVTFAIQRSEFVFLIGKTGSGKSSLLKTLYGDLPVKSGYVKVAGFDVGTITNCQMPLLRRKLGIIFQDFQLLLDRSVQENLWFVLRATGWKNKLVMKRRIAEVLVKVGLDQVGDKMPYQLSGGEQQRLAIARALLNNPLILLADEPTGNLDPEIAQDILSLFLAVNRAGTAIIMATHNYGLIAKQSCRLFKCNNRRLIEGDCGTTYNA